MSRAADLSSIYRLEFYKKQNNWKFRHEVRQEKAAPPLDQTYNVNREGHADAEPSLNDAFLECSDKNLPLSDNSSQTSPTEESKSCPNSTQKSGPDTGKTASQASVGTLKKTDVSSLKKRPRKKRTNALKQSPSTRNLLPPKNDFRSVRKCRSHEKNLRPCQSDATSKKALESLPEQFTSRKSADLKLTEEDNVVCKVYDPNEKSVVRVGKESASPKPEPKCPVSQRINKLVELANLEREKAMQNQPAIQELALAESPASSGPLGLGSQIYPQSLTNCPEPTYWHELCMGGEGMADMVEGYGDKDWPNISGIQSQGSHIEKAIGMDGVRTGWDALVSETSLPDVTEDKDLTTFIRGAQCAPHSSEINLLTALVYSKEYLGSAMEHDQRGAQCEKTLSTQSLATLLSPHLSNSFEDYPTRDVGLLPAYLKASFSNDIIVAGSFKNNPLKSYDFEIKIAEPINNYPHNVTRENNFENGSVMAVQYRYSLNTESNRQDSPNVFLRNSSNANMADGNLQTQLVHGLDIPYISNRGNNVPPAYDLKHGDAFLSGDILSQNYLIGDGNSPKNHLVYSVPACTQPQLSPNVPFMPQTPGYNAPGYELPQNFSLNNNLLGASPCEYNSANGHNTQRYNMSHNSSKVPNMPQNCPNMPHHYSPMPNMPETSLSDRYNISHNAPKVPNMPQNYPNMPHHYSPVPNISETFPKVPHMPQNCPNMPHHYSSVPDIPETSRSDNVSNPPFGCNMPLEHSIAIPKFNPNYPPPGYIPNYPSPGYNNPHIYPISHDAAQKCCLPLDIPDNVSPGKNEHQNISPGFSQPDSARFSFKETRNIPCDQRLPTTYNEVTEDKACKNALCNASQAEDCVNISDANNNRRDEISQEAGPEPGEGNDRLSKNISDKFDRNKSASLPGNVDKRIVAYLKNVIEADDAVNIAQQKGLVEVGKKSCAFIKNFDLRPKEPKTQNSVNRNGNLKSDNVVIEQKVVNRKVVRIGSSKQNNNFGHGCNTTAVVNNAGGSKDSMNNDRHANYELLKEKNNNIDKNKNLKVESLQTGVNGRTTTWGQNWGNKLKDNIVTETVKNENNGKGRISTGAGNNQRTDIVRTNHDENCNKNDVFFGMSVASKLQTHIKNNKNVCNSVLMNVKGKVLNGEPHGKDNTVKTEDLVKPNANCDHGARKENTVINQGQRQTRTMHGQTRSNTYKDPRTGEIKCHSRRNIYEDLRSNKTQGQNRSNTCSDSKIDENPPQIRPYSCRDSKFDETQEQMRKAWEECDNNAKTARDNQYSHIDKYYVRGANIREKGVNLGDMGQIILGRGRGRLFEEKIEVRGRGRTVKKVVMN